MTDQPPPPLQVLAGIATPVEGTTEPTQNKAPGERVTHDRPDPSLLPPMPATVRSGRLLFHQVAPHPDDPPGLIRWCVQQPDGRIRPQGATPADELPPRRPHLTAVPNPPEPD